MRACNRVLAHAQAEDDAAGKNGVDQHGVATQESPRDPVALPAVAPLMLVPGGGEDGEQKTEEGEMDEEEREEEQKEIAELSHVLCENGGYEEGREEEEEEEEEVFFPVSESEAEVTRKIEALRRFQARTRSLALAKLDVVPSPPREGAAHTTNHSHPTHTLGLCACACACAHA